jgi:hypothetical protein
VAAPAPAPEVAASTEAKTKAVAAKAKPKVTAAKRKPDPSGLKTAARSSRPAVQGYDLKRVTGLRHNDLMTAVLDGDVDSVNELLKLGKWADKPDSRGATPLMVAAERGDVRTAEALLRAGANARLAVPVAEERRNGEMVQLLKRHTR